MQEETERLKLFWESRYRDFKLSESGWLGAGERNNSYLYACKVQALRSALAALGYGQESRFSVLDAGCGQGFFPSFYESWFPQAHYSGVDISERVIDHLRRCFPSREFSAGDVATWRHPEGRRFDVIQCFDVLYLILDDSVVASTLANLMSQLAPRGHLLITAVLPPQTTLANSYVRYRGREFYQSLFARIGLTLEAERRMYYWLPEGGPRNRYVRKVLHWLGPYPLYIADRVALRIGLPPVTSGLDSRMKLLTLHLTDRKGVPETTGKGEAYRGG